MFVIAKITIIQVRKHYYYLTIINKDKSIKSAILTLLDNTAAVKCSALFNIATSYVYCANYVSLQPINIKEVNTTHFKFTFSKYNSSVNLLIYSQLLNVFANRQQAVQESKEIKLCININTCTATTITIVQKNSLRKALHTLIGLISKFVFKGFLGNTIVQLTLAASRDNAYSRLKQLLTPTATEAAYYQLKKNVYSYLYKQQTPLQHIPYVEFTSAKVNSNSKLTVYRSASLRLRVKFKLK